MVAKTTNYLNISIPSQANGSYPRFIYQVTLIVHLTI